MTTMGPSVGMLLVVVLLVAFPSSLASAGPCRAKCNSQRRDNQSRCINSKKMCSISKNLKSKCESRCLVRTRNCINGCKASLRRDARKCKKGCRNAAIKQQKKCNAGCEKNKKEIRRERLKDGPCACPRTNTRIAKLVNCSSTGNAPYETFPNQCVAECEGYKTTECFELPSQPFGSGP